MYRNVSITEEHWIHPQKSTVASSVPERHLIQAQTIRMALIFLYATLFDLLPSCKCQRTIIAWTTRHNHSFLFVWANKHWITFHILYAGFVSRVKSKWILHVSYMYWSAKSYIFFSCEHILLQHWKANVQYSAKWQYMLSYVLFYYINIWCLY